MDIKERKKRIIRRIKETDEDWVIEALDRILLIEDDESEELTENQKNELDADYLARQQGKGEEFTWAEVKSHIHKAKR